MNKENKDKLKLLKRIRIVKGNEPEEKMIECLKKLQEVSPEGLKIVERVIYFMNEKERNKLCKLFDKPTDSYGIVDMIEGSILEGGTTVFFCINRDSKANKFSHAYKIADTEEERAEVGINNRNNRLLWHQNVMIYQDGCAYLYDPNFCLEENPKRVLKAFPFASKFRKLIAIMEEKTERDVEIYLGGGGNFDEKCRQMSIQFVKSLISARLKGKKCDHTSFYEFKKGPRTPCKSKLEGLKVQSEI